MWCNSDTLIIIVCLFSNKSPGRWQHELPKHDADHNTIKVHLYIKVCFLVLNFISCVSVTITALSIYEDYQTPKLQIQQSEQKTNFALTRTFDYNLLF